MDDDESLVNGKTLLILSEICLLHILTDFKSIERIMIDLTQKITVGGSRQNSIAITNEQTFCSNEKVLHCGAMNYL